MLKTLLKSAVTIITLVIILGGLLGLVIFGFSTYNKEVEKRADYEQFENERKAFYTNMSQTIKSKSQIAVQNDSSFRQNIDIIMSGRKDAENIMMKWITETNPNANFAEVSALYKDLSRTVEAKRDQFFEQEKKMQDIDKEHKLLLRKPLTGFILKTILGVKPLGYKSISSEATEKTFSTGIEEDVKLF